MDNKDNALDFKHYFREANKPEPIEKVLKTQAVVSWGDDNLYPQFLNSLVADNPVHGGIIEQKVKFITAGGLDTKLSDKSILNAKRDGYTYEEIMRDCVRDFEIGETFAIHWKKVAEKGSFKWYPKHIDFELLRAKEDGSGYAYCENWSAPSKCDSYKEYTDISAIDKATDFECIQVVITKPKQRILDNGKGKKVLSKAYYPIPSYSGAITDIMAGIEMSYFSYAETVNGFKGGTLINLANGKPQEIEKQRKLEAGIKEMFSDRNKQGGIAITYSEGKDREPMVSQINGNDLDKRYQEAKKTARDAIMVAHGVISPSLFGVFTESMFGSKEEMETAYLLFRENYVKARQNNVLAPINWVYEYLNGINPEFYYLDFVPEILKPTQSQNSTFSKEDEEPTFEDVKAEFEKCGRSKEGLRIIETRCLDHDNFDEKGFKANYSKKGFARVTELQARILEMIDKGETYDAIKRALDISSFKLSVELVKLRVKKLVKDWKLTEEGVRSIVDETKIEVVYSYEVRNNVPPAKQSREFCEYMVNRNMVYTKQEIDNISDVIGRDVWMYRGGWYHNPQTNRNTPFCRHEWKQHVILK